MESAKRLKRFILEFGMGLDQHGQDPTKAACKAVKAAVANQCLAGLLEICRLKNVNDMIVEIQVACPFPEKVNEKAVADALPFGSKTVKITQGGMVVHGLFQPELGDNSDEAYIANACVIVWADMDVMLDSWKQG